MLDIGLLKGAKVTRLMNDQVAGTTTVNGSSVDMNGYDGVMFVGLFGALTATQVTELKGQSSPDNGVDTAFADLAYSHVGPLADANSNCCLLLDIYRPQQRYVRPVIVRGTANAVIDGVIAIQYSPARQPTTNDPTTVVGTKYLKSPPLGTA